MLDADDIITEPEVVRRYADILGFDREKLRFEWDVASEEEVGKMGPMERRMRSTLDASKGIVEGKTAKGLDLDNEARKWKQEFGEELGQEMESLVQDAMSDYEYLRSRRMRAVEGSDNELNHPTAAVPGR